jgi:heme exporter protein C
MGMFIYLVMAAYALTGLVFNTRLSVMMMQALAPTGALFTAVALWTGALWGRPTWGTYWVWDARMTSTLILLFLYFGYMALDNAIEDRRRADKAGALLVLVGAVNIPIIYFSVRWWNTLHQGATLAPGSSKMASTMLTAMLLMTFACWAYSIAVALVRVRSIIIEREKGAAWLSELAAPATAQASGANSGKAA